MSITDRLKKFDTPAYGIIISIILLIIGFLISYLTKTWDNGLPLSRYFNLLTSNTPDRLDILIFSLLPNMFLFYLTNFRWRMHEFIKGQVGVAVLFCLIIIFLSV